MKILSMEDKKDMCSMECEFTGEEINILVNYAVKMILEESIKNEKI
uniref:Uncharacterized protein n=1 Tax=viral metagenome TaxID=1070528 RepID=A0A6M3IM35_9ZZZZ